MKPLNSTIPARILLTVPDHSIRISTSLLPLGRTRGAAPLSDTLRSILGPGMCGTQQAASILRPGASKDFSGTSASDSTLAVRSMQSFRQENRFAERSSRCYAPRYFWVIWEPGDEEYIYKVGRNKSNLNFFRPPRATLESRGRPRSERAPGSLPRVRAKLASFRQKPAQTVKALLVSGSPGGNCSLTSPD